MKPTRPCQLKITPAKDSEWSEKRKQALVQDGLFHSEDVRKRPLLKKLPYDFYYVYEIDTANGTERLEHMITDWEIGMLFWHCYYSPDWESKFRAKLEGEFSKKDMYLILGTMHRFPKQWLIIGLVYPPMPNAKLVEQLGFQF